MRFVSQALFAVAILSVGLPLRATDPPLRVAESDPPPEAAALSVKCAVGRFVPLEANAGAAALVVGNEANAVALYPIKAGESVFGIRFDEPDGAKLKRYTFPKADWIAVAGEKSVVAHLSVVVNGKTPKHGEGEVTPPVVVARMQITVVGTEPAPGVQPLPAAVPPPVALTAFQIQLQATIRADGATTDEVKLYASYFRTAAKTAQDPKLPTVAALDQDMGVAIKVLGLPPGSLALTAQTVQVQLAVVVPYPVATPLDAALRDRYTATYQRIAADLLAAGGK